MKDKDTHLLAEAYGKMHPIVKAALDAKMPRKIDTKTGLNVPKGTDNGKFEIKNSNSNPSLKSLFFKELGGNYKLIGTFNSTEEAINRAEQIGLNPA